MNYKDGFIAMHSELEAQIAGAPFEDFPDGFSAERFFLNYHALETRSEMVAEIERDAASIFEASSLGYIEDTYSSLAEVPRDRLMRVRVFENGEIHTYPDNGQETPQIGDEEAADWILPRVSIYEDFGLEEPQDDTPTP